jgi:uncharacterized protein YndB with AHSA1/START domain
MTKTIRQTVTIKASPKKVFEALMDEKKHAAFTGMAATISRKTGGAFSCYGGYLSGFQLDAVPGKRIVQAWRGRSWPKGYYSIVTFALAPNRAGGTKLTFTHLGVPSGDFKSKSAGWRSHYWKPLKAYLEA